LGLGGSSGHISMDVLAAHDNWVATLVRQGLRGKVNLPDECNLLLHPVKWESSKKKVLEA
jgi:hypothetical protein